MSYLSIVVAVIVVAVIAVWPYSLHQATPGLIGAQFWKAQGMTSNPVCFDFAVLVASNFLLAIIHIHTMVCVLTPVLTPLLLF